MLISDKRMVNTPQCVSSEVWNHNILYLLITLHMEVKGEVVKIEKELTLGGYDILSWAKKYMIRTSLGGIFISLI